MEERLLELIRLARKYNVSSIHFQKMYEDLQIQMLVDGQRCNVKTKIGDDKLLKYLKYLSCMDVEQKDIPQTGVFELEIDNKLDTFRYAIIESLNTTTACLRIL